MMATKIGLRINLRDPAVIEMAAAAGYDFIWIDCEQTIFPEIGELIRAAEAASIECWVRVGQNNAGEIARILNLGPRGVIVPHIDSRSNAEKAVRHTKHQPVGNRNWFSKVKIASMGSWLRKIPAARSATTKLVVQIEDPEGIENVDEILGVKGIDLVMTGPGDLARSWGIAGQLEHPRIQQAEAIVFHAANRHNISVVHFANTAEELSKILKDHPVRYVVAASDIAGVRSFLQDRRDNLVRAMRQHTL
jgi:2-keto-3-deoxy-L-rhamnonate aldolase RhmA